MKEKLAEKRLEANKKEEAKGRDAQEKTMKKMRKDTLDIACKTVAKLQTPTELVRGLLFKGTVPNPNMDKVPGLIADKAKHVFEKAQLMTMHARGTMANSGAPMPFVTIGEVKAVGESLDDVIGMPKPFKQILEKA